MQEKYRLHENTHGRMPQNGTNKVAGEILDITKIAVVGQIGMGLAGAAGGLIRPR